jgi:hypothetical protein
MLQNLKKSILAFLLIFTILGGISHVASASTTLTDNLVGYWNLNKTGGTYSDSVNGNNLTETGGTVNTAVGVVNNAAALTGTSYLSVNDNATLSTGDIDFTIGGWVYLTSKSANKGLFGKFTTTSNQREYLVYYDSGSDRFRFNVSSNGTAATILTANNGGAPSLNTWYYVVGWHDSVNNTLNIQVNNGTADSVSYSSGVFDGTTAFAIGAFNGAANILSGRVDAVGLWKRVLTVGERTTLYNSGAGAEYPFVPAAPTGLIATPDAGQVSLSWTSGSVGIAITDYVIEYKLSSDSVWTTFSDGTSTSTSTIVTGLANNSSYDFRVSATNSQGTGAVSSTATATPVVSAPSAPQSLVATSGYQQVGLSWTAPTSTGGSPITDYVIEYKLSSDSVWTTFSDGTSTSTSTIVTGLANNNVYNFRTSAVNAIGTSTPSATANATPPGLVDGLVAFWDLNESSGSRADSVGSSTLTEQGGSVSSATGKINNAAVFAGTNYLAVDDNTTLSTGDIDFTLSGWAYLTSKSTSQGIAMKFNSTTNQREYGIFYNQPTDRFRFTLSDTGGSGSGHLPQLNADSLGSPALDTWYYVVAWHDAANNTMNIQVNNGSIDSMTWTSGVFDGTSKLYVGAYTDANVISGRVDAIGLWKRILTPLERTELYKFGRGIEYPLTVQNTVSISSPVSYQVIQRSDSNLADIPISGGYIGTPTAIEASWNGGSYQTIVSSPSNNTYSGTLTGQTAGEGILSVRFVDDVATTDTQMYVGVGDVFVVAGQSNAEGRGTNNQVYTSPSLSLKAGLFGNDDVWKELVDPTDSWINQIDSVSNDDPNAAGSVWPNLATYILADQNIPVAFIPSAKGGSTITDWQPDNTDHNNRTTLYGSMHRRILAAGGHVKAILFLQGENDATDGTSTTSYKALLNTFANAVYDDFGVKTSLAQIGRRATVSDDNVNNIRVAQRELWDEGEEGLNHIVSGPTLYDVPVSSTDDVHFIDDASLQTIAKRWWSALKADFYGGTDGRGPQLSSATRSQDGTMLYLTFTDDTLPLIPTTNIEGFRVKNDGVVVPIASIDRIRDDQLQITLSSAATDSVTVSLGFGSDDGYNVLVPTDSTQYRLPAEFFINYPVTLIGSSPSKQVSSGSGGYYIPMPVSSSSPTSTSSPDVGTSISVCSPGDIFNKNTGSLCSSAPLAPISSFTRTLYIGTRGDDVRVLQVYLGTHGFLEITPTSYDGVFGHLTKAAVIAFQEKYSLVMDGRVGVKTREKMNK